LFAIIEQDVIFACNVVVEIHRWHFRVMLSI